MLNEEQAIKGICTQPSSQNLALIALHLFCSKPTPRAAHVELRQKRPGFLMLHEAVPGGDKVAPTGQISDPSTMLAEQLLVVLKIYSSE